MRFALSNLLSENHPSLSRQFELFPCLRALMASTILRSAIARHCTDVNGDTISSGAFLLVKKQGSGLGGPVVDAVERLGGVAPGAGSKMFSKPCCAPWSAKRSWSVSWSSSSELSISSSSAMMVSRVNHLQARIDDFG